MILTLIITSLPSNQELFSSQLVWISTKPLNVGDRVISFIVGEALIIMEVSGICSRELNLSFHWWDKEKEASHLVWFEILTFPGGYKTHSNFKGRLSRYIILDSSKKYSVKLSYYSVKIWLYKNQCFILTVDFRKFPVRILPMGLRSSSAHNGWHFGVFES